MTDKIKIAFIISLCFLVMSFHIFATYKYFTTDDLNEKMNWGYFVLNRGK